MPRKQRVWYEGACYHVMGRGNRRNAIFREEDDYRLFISILRKVREKHMFTLHSFCLMTNHFHLQMTTGTDPIWKIMQRFMNFYARTFNLKYGYEGHLFDSRYTSALIEDDRYFLEVSRYIHLNPVKAQMVKEPLSYPYSSYELYVRERVPGRNICGMAADLMDTTRILDSFSQDSREQYRMFVEEKISHAEQELQIQKDMKEDDLWLPS